ncbi:MAG TPA: type II toxin-antitoxin system PemK/MazF family toxin [Pseudomonas sp.]|nr:type II toxin-antitoxin system PemK/MazF family toxin [Pseudomonas sp.]
MNRGDFVSIAMRGDFGEPRPALVIQVDQFDAHATVTVLLVSSTLIDAPLFRVTVQPTKENGLQKMSQFMVDKAMTSDATNWVRPSALPVMNCFLKLVAVWRCFWGLSGSSFQVQCG